MSPDCAEAGAVTCAAQLLPDTARFLLAAAVIVALAAGGGALAVRCGKPRVLGELAAGLLLGPFGLAGVAPPAVRWLQAPDTAAAVRAVAESGIALFAYLIGYELRTAGGPRSRTVLSVTAGAVAVPAALGLAIAPVVRPMVSAPGAPAGAFAAFFALICTVTALPVLARLLPDVALAGTWCGRLALTVAACTDVSVWAGLTVVLTVVDPRAGPARMWVVVAALMTLVLSARLVVRPLVLRAARRSGAGPSTVQVLVVSIALFAATTQGLGLHASLGALLVGVTMPRVPAVDLANRHFRSLTSAVLLPLFFGSIGLDLPAGALADGRAVAVAFALLVVVMTGAKVAGAWLGGLLAGLPAVDGIRLGVLLNCRGVTEIVVVTIGFQHHLIGATGLVVLLLVTVASVVAIAPVCRRLPAGTVERPGAPDRTGTADGADRAGAGTAAAAEPGVS